MSELVSKVALPQEGPLTLVLASTKGGVGKTTLATGLATGLMVRGRAVRLVDADVQGTATYWHKVRVRSGKAGPALWRALSVDGLTEALTGGGGFAVVDTAGTDAELLRAALVAADVALVPFTPDAKGVWATLFDTLPLIERARVHNPGLRAFGICSLGERANQDNEESVQAVREAGLAWSGLIVSRNRRWQGADSEGEIPGEGVAWPPRVRGEFRKLVDWVEAL